MTLVVEVRRRAGAFTLDVDFRSGGGLTALFGPSGSGKTTIVNLVGGLLRPDAGRIEVGGETLVDVAEGRFVPPYRRRVGYVFQDARLFPHLTVAQNLGYGRFFTPRRERWADLGRIVEMLGIGPLLGRRPGALSGGERSRAAIGRALAASPRLLLMDEPLASLDEARKAEILPYVERLRDEAGIPIVYVSHAIAEVARLATDIVVLAAGRVAASGPAGEVLARLDLAAPEEREHTAALVEARLEGHDAEFGLSRLASAAGPLLAPRVEAPVGARLRLRIRARDVMLALDRPERISALNVWPATVTGIETAGAAADVLARLDAGGVTLLARVTRRTVATLGLGPGVPVWAIVKAVSFDRGNAPGPTPAGG
ncbi:molybdenum ABC transporter ATP-binding protein [Amaricoccus sp.]|uniref:molybdenum ABC transporter ATP-binding protein n=1 Tax=Amaricoccus sp. TaxID=1872485 RepID=UPI001B7B0F6E|nr:molybdenum ABC transporter ATP-binding protein [Amaricoccus sp.]MBP7003727.1 molybdenum ABC transporter ATP-binding protein [Amaricoccus sp.]